MMTEQPLVSIGLPCYNRPESLKKAIECILNQTYTNLELIISNDASPNPAVKPMLDEFAKRDQRIRLYHQPIDLQVYGNYYFVQEQATGKYFMYMQDDDLWEPESIELLVQNLEQNPQNEFVIAKSEYIDEQGKSWQIFDFTNQNKLTFIFGEKAPFVWMGLWRIDKLRNFDYDGKEVHGKDIIVAAEAIISYPYGYIDKLLYHKTLYHEKASDYINAKPFCHFTMYGNMLKEIATNPHVKNRGWLLILIPASCVGIIRMYSAYLLFQLPVDHWFRSFIRKVYRAL